MNSGQGDAENGEKDRERLKTYHRGHGDYTEHTEKALRSNPGAQGAQSEIEHTDKP